jgi:hypothetical protein
VISSPSDSQIQILEKFFSFTLPLALKVSTEKRFLIIAGGKIVIPHQTTTTNTKTNTNTIMIHRSKPNPICSSSTTCRCTIARRNFIEIKTVAARARKNHKEGKFQFQ